MYRTDKQFMKNPATAGSRIYIGSLPKTVVADDLEARFKDYGKILGLVLQQGFAFIQYEHDHEAKAAIASVHNTILHGRKINVRQAFDKPKNQNAHNMQQNQNYFQQRPNPNQQNQVPNQSQAPQQQKPPALINHPPKSIPQEKEIVDDMKEPKLPTPQSKPQEIRRGVRGGRGRRPAPPERFLDPQYRDDMYCNRDMYPLMDSGPRDRNDCEIIVVSKALTEYAEYIELKLKQMGLIVDLLFPNEDVPIGRVLANISSRGCLFAILIMPQNEEHRSLTLNILHGIPQEHRNMPIEDAILLISRNFESYMRGEKPPENTAKMTVGDRHPVPMQMLLNLLAENRMLSTNQYDKLITYLQERRELQMQHEIAEGIQPDSQDNSNSKQTELQNRIMSILNNKNDVTIPASITASEPPSNTPLLKDPSVQKALDSLLLGDMFKSIGGS